MKPQPVSKSFAKSTSKIEDPSSSSHLAESANSERVNIDSQAHQVAEDVISAWSPVAIERPQAPELRPNLPLVDLPALPEPQPPQIVTVPPSSLAIENSTPEIGPIDSASVPLSTTLPQVASASASVDLPTAHLPSTHAPTLTSGSGEPAMQSAPLIEVEITGVRVNRGSVKVAVFTSAEKFLDPTGAAQTIELGDSSSTVTANLNVRETCAIAVFQDIDGNRQLTVNRRGIPVEPCAFSNNAVIKRGPPSFSAAAIQPTASPQRVRIELP